MPDPDAWNPSIVSCPNPELKTKWSLGWASMVSVER